MKKIDMQNQRVNTLIELLKANSELEIVPMVDYEVCADDDFRYWMGSWGESRLDEYLHDEEKIHFRSQDEDRLVDEVWDDEDKYPNITHEDAKKIVANFAWEKCIVVYIETP